MSDATLLFVVGRFRIVVATIPVVTVLVMIRYGIWAAWDASGATTPEYNLSSNVIFTFLGTSIFVLSILLGGVMGDFKESEKMPSDLETMFQMLLTHIMSVAASKGADVEPVLRALQSLLRATALVVDGTESADVAGAAMRDAEVALLVELEARGAYLAPIVCPSLLNLRKSLSRLRVIRDTCFVLPVYTLFDTITSLVIILLLGTRFDTPTSGYLTTGVFIFLYVYMSLLVRDLGACGGSRAPAREQGWEEGRSAATTPLLVTAAARTPPAPRASSPPRHPLPPSSAPLR